MIFMVTLRIDIPRGVSEYTFVVGPKCGRCPLYFHMAVCNGESVSDSQFCGLINPKFGYLELGEEHTCWFVRRPDSAVMDSRVLILRDPIN